MKFYSISNLLGDFIGIVVGTSKQSALEEAVNMNLIPWQPFETDYYEVTEISKTDFKNLILKTEESLKHYKITFRKYSEFIKKS